VSPSYVRLRVRALSRPVSFAFAISLVVPAGTYEEGQNATHDVTVVHAVKVEPIEQV
jgi:hypothetical protein